MKNYLKYILPVLVTTCIIYLAAILPTDDLFLVNNEIYELSGDFQVVLPDGRTDRTSLPASYEVETGKTLEITKKFEENLPDSSHMRIRSSMQYIKVYIDESLIFENLKMESDGLNTPEASAWYIFALPNQLEGKTLKMTISSPVNAFSGLINPINYGDSASLRFELISRHMVIFISSLILSFFSIIMLVVYFLLRRNVDDRIYYLSLFILTTNLWLLSEMDLLQFFTGNRFMVGGISYVLMPLIPICLMQYMTAVALKRHRKLISAISSLFFLQFVINLYLQLAGKVYFMDSIPLILSLVLFSVVIISVLLIHDAYKFKDKVSIKYLAYLSFFFATVVIEVVMFFTENYDIISSYSGLGFMAFLILLIVDSVRYMNEMISRISETNIYKKLAYMDILTKGLNRAAFERDIKNILNLDIAKSFRLVSADLNNLKLINDNYGHQEGDKAIIQCYESLSEACPKNTLCYRLGGDEFTCIFEDIEDTLYFKFLSQLDNSIREASSEKPYELQLALGTGIYEHSKGESVEDFIHRVDLQMYENKKLKKMS